MNDQPKNRVWPTECRHVRAGNLPAIESVRFETIGPVGDDFRYGKGPDTMRICAFCSGMLLGLAGKADIL